jgi:hypothetical protein
MKRNLQKAVQTELLFGSGSKSTEALVLDLNEMEDRAVAESLGQLICDFMNLSRMAKEKEYVDDQGRLVGSKPRELWKKIQSQLGTVTWSPYLFPPSKKRGLQYIWAPQGSARVEISQYVGIIFNLAARGMLTRIRRCRNCEKWLLASRGIHRFCSVNCRVLYYRRTPQGRIRNKKYMQGYRARQKRRDQNMLRVSRKGW